MAERRQRGVEADRARATAPTARDRTVLDPAAAAFLVGAGNEGRVGIPVGARRRPHRLRLGPDDRDRAVALELPAVAAVDQAPVGPGLGDQSRKLHHALRRLRPMPEARGRRWAAMPAKGTIGRRRTDGCSAPARRRRSARLQPGGALAATSRIRVLLSGAMIPLTGPPAQFTAHSGSSTSQPQRSSRALRRRSRNRRYGHSLVRPRSLRLRSRATPDSGKILSHGGTVAADRLSAERSEKRSAEALQPRRSAQQAFLPLRPLQLPDAEADHRGNRGEDNDRRDQRQPIGHCGRRRGFLHLVPALSRAPVIPRVGAPQPPQT